MVYYTSSKIWLLQVFALLVLVIFFIWLGIRPRSPSYTVSDFSVHNGTISFTLQFGNPNKDSQIYYDNINFTCYHNQNILGSVIIPAFSQHKGVTTPKLGKITLDSEVWKALQNDISNKRAELQVALVTQMRYRTWGIKSPRHKVHLKAQLQIGTEGKIPGKTRMHNSSKKWRIKMT